MVGQRCPAKNRGEIKMYNKDNENKIFDDDIAKTIFYGRSDIILRGRAVEIALDEIERGRVGLVESLLMEIKNGCGKRVYGNYSTENGLKILHSKIENGEFVVGPCIYDEDGDMITTFMSDDGECYFASSLAMEEAGLKPLEVEFFDNRSLEERVNESIRMKDRFSD